MFTAKEVKLFEHTRLNSTTDEIRLFRLEPRRKPEEVIRGELKLFKLHRAPPFIALSYMWGAKTPLGPILLNDPVALFVCLWVA